MKSGAWLKVPATLPYLLVLFGLTTCQPFLPRAPVSAFGGEQNQAGLLGGQTDLQMTAAGPLQFKLGFLAPWKNSFDDISALTSASAISIAIASIQADPIMNQRINFT